jgi:predicted ATP-grasp superfamily ATP-dependent carboligase
VILTKFACIKKVDACSGLAMSSKLINIKQNILKDNIHAEKLGVSCITNLPLSVSRRQYMATHRRKRGGWGGCSPPNTFLVGQILLEKRAAISNCLN